MHYIKLCLHVLSTSWYGADLYVFISQFPIFAYGFACVYLSWGESIYVYLSMYEVDITTCSVACAMCLCLSCWD